MLHLYGWVFFRRAILKYSSGEYPNISKSCKWKMWKWPGWNFWFVCPSYIAVLFVKSLQDSLRNSPKEGLRGVLLRSLPRVQVQVQLQLVLNREQQFGTKKQKNPQGKLVLPLLREKNHSRLFLLDSNAISHKQQITKRFFNAFFSSAPTVTFSSPATNFTSSAKVSNSMMASTLLAWRQRRQRGA